jgi:hypothetical protein
VEPTTLFGDAAKLQSPGKNIVESKFDPDYWRERAEEARTLAQAMTHPVAKRHMHFIAQAYERLADHAECAARHKRGT